VRGVVTKRTPVAADAIGDLVADDAP